MLLPSYASTDFIVSFGFVNLIQDQADGSIQDHVALTAADRDERSGDELVNERVRRVNLAAAQTSRQVIRRVRPLLPGSWRCCCLG